MEFSVCGKSISSATVTPTNGVITYAIPQDVMIIPVTETVIGVQVIGHNGDTIIKSPIVKARISNSLQDSSAVASDSPVDVETRVEQLEAVKHTHTNKAVLDKFAEKDGKPTYDGNAIGGGGTGGASTAEEVSYTNADLPDVSNVKGALDYIAETQQAHEDDINTLDDKFTELDKKAHTHDNKAVLDSIITTPVSTVNGQNGDVKSAWYVTVTTNDNNGYSADKTPPEIMAAVNDGYAVYCNITINRFPSTLPLFIHNNIISVFSGAGGVVLGRVDLAGFPAQYLTVAITGSEVYVEQEFLARKNDIPTEVSAFENDAGYLTEHQDLTAYAKKTDIPTALKNPYALTINVDGADTAYDGSAAKAVAVKGATKQVTSGTTITLADNTEYRLTDVTTLTLTYPTGDFESWLSLTFAESGTITVTLPTGTKYLGSSPDFQNGEVWELSIKDGVVVAQKVGDGA